MRLHQTHWGTYLLFVAMFVFLTPTITSHVHVNDRQEATTTSYLEGPFEVPTPLRHESQNIACDENQVAISTQPSAKRSVYDRKRGALRTQRFDFHIPDRERVDRVRFSPNGQLGAVISHSETRASEASQHTLKRIRVYDLTGKHPILMRTHEFKNMVRGNLFFSRDSKQSLIYLSNGAWSKGTLYKGSVDKKDLEKISRVEGMVVDAGPDLRLVQTLKLTRDGSDLEVLRVSDGIALARSRSGYSAVDFLGDGKAAYKDYTHSPNSLRLLQDKDKESKQIAHRHRGLGRAHLDGDRSLLSVVFPRGEISLESLSGSVLASKIDLGLGEINNVARCTDGSLLLKHRNPSSPNDKYSIFSPRKFMDAIARPYQGLPVAEKLDKLIADVQERQASSMTVPRATYVLRNDENAIAEIKTSIATLTKARIRALDKLNQFVKSKLEQLESDDFFDREAASESIVKAVESTLAMDPRLIGDVRLILSEVSNSPQLTAEGRIRLDRIRDNHPKNEYSSKNSTLSTLQELLSSLTDVSNVN